MASEVYLLRSHMQSMYVNRACVASLPLCLGTLPLTKELNIPPRQSSPLREHVSPGGLALNNAL